MFPTVFLASMILVIPVGIISFRVWNGQKRNGSEGTPPVAIPIAVSAVQFALAYSVVYFVQELFLWWPKAILGLDAVLYHNNHTWSVSHPVDQLLQGTGALAIFVAGLLIAVAYRMRTPRAPGLRLFVLWVIYHAFTQSVFQLSDPVVNPNGDVGDALGYLGYPAALAVPTFVAAIIAIAALGAGLSRQFAAVLPSLSGAGSPGQQIRFAAVWIIGSGFLGAVLLIPFKLPPLEQIVGPFILAVLPGLWVVAFWGRRANGETTTVALSTRDLIISGALLILTLAFFQIVLAPGIRI